MLAAGQIVFQALIAIEMHDRWIGRLSVDEDRDAGAEGEGGVLMQRCCHLRRSEHNGTGITIYGSDICAVDPTSSSLRPFIPPSLRPPIKTIMPLVKQSRTEAPVP
jgi:hypothetical protein